MRIPFFFALLLALAPGLVWANQEPAKYLQAQAIRQQQAEIRADAEARKGRYKNMPQSRRNELFQRQDRVASLLGNVELTTELLEQDQLRLFNELEAISAIVNNAEEERMVCRRHKPVGSNRPKTVCRTVGQLRADQETSSKDLRMRNNECSTEMMGPGGCPR